MTGEYETSFSCEGGAKVTTWYYEEEHMPTGYLMNALVEVSAGDLVDGLTGLCHSVNGDDAKPPTDNLFDGDGLDPKWLRWLEGNCSTTNPPPTTVGRPTTTMPPATTTEPPTTTTTTTTTTTKPHRDFKEPPMTTLPPSTTTKKPPKCYLAETGETSCDDVCKAEDKKCRGGYGPSTGPSSRMTTVAPPTTTLPPKTTTEPPTTTAAPTTTVVAYSTESALIACREAFPGHSALPKSRNKWFQLASWQSGCYRASVHPTLAVCVANCGRTGCCTNPPTAALASGVDTFTRCRSNSCSGGGCCRASGDICKRACAAFPQPQLPKAARSHLVTKYYQPALLQLEEPRSSHLVTKYYHHASSLQPPSILGADDDDDVMMAPTQTAMPVRRIKSLFDEDDDDTMLKPEETELLSTKSSATSTCSCPAELKAAGEVKTCSSSGDPHFRNWDLRRFDFMGMGAFQYAKVELPGCGCEVDVQVVMAANTKYRGATSNVAVAMAVGGITFVVRADLTLTIISATGEEKLSKGDANGWSTEHGAQTAEYVTKKYKRLTLGGWSIGLPGAPGRLLVYGFPTRGMPETNILDVWLSLPAGTDFGAAGGLCEGKCRGRSPVPNGRCDEGDDCIPLYREDSIFPEEALKSIEATYFGGVTATRAVTREGCKPGERDVQRRHGDVRRQARGEAAVRWHP
jgi:hypothetical protein